jgi:uncharacterized protein (TIGR03086 family)
MDAKEIFFYGVDQATAVIVQVAPEQMDLPTPDTEWNVHDLVRHLLYELSWVPDVVEGKTLEEVGDKYDGDLFGDDFAESWQAAVARARRAVDLADEDDIVHLSSGNATVKEYLWQIANDLLVHAWDLGQAVGVSVVFDEEVAYVLYEKMKTEAEAYRRGGLFAAAVEVSANATTQVKLLALEGRSIYWADT